PAASTVDGVITTASHADVVHELFRTGARFRISVTPADAVRTDDASGADGAEGAESGAGTPATTFEGCTLLSSSGKWVGSLRSD
ncbi:hypothetical protein ACFQE1_19885, partial [Halobium palmae]